MTADREAPGWDPAIVFPGEEVLWSVRAPRSVAYETALVMVPCGIALALFGGDAWLLHRLDPRSVIGETVVSPTLMQIALVVFGVAMIVVALRSAWVARRTSYVVTRQRAAVVVGRTVLPDQSWYADGSCGYEARSDLAGRGDLVMWREWRRESKGRRRRVEQGFFGLADVPEAERALRTMLGVDRAIASAVPDTNVSAIRDSLSEAVWAMLARSVPDEHVVWGHRILDTGAQRDARLPVCLVTDRRLLLFAHGGWPLRAFDAKAVFSLDLRGPRGPILQLSFERSEFDEGPPGISMAEVSDAAGLERAINQLMLGQRRSGDASEESRAGRDGKAPLSPLPANPPSA